MASHSPQRARRPPGHPVSQGNLHNLREASRSPSLRDRSRTLKAQSMPIVPSAMQVFATSAQQTSPQAQQQPSPTLSINSRRSPAPGVQVQRLLPTPPHPNPVNINSLNSHDPSPERHMSPPLPAQHSHNPPNPHYPRPINRSHPQFLSKFQNVEQDSWQMTDELLAEIERADQQQLQAQTNPPHPYGTSYPRGQSNSPPKDPAVERVRATERSSPKEFDMAQGQQRRPPPQRESPKAPNKQPTSPTVPSFSTQAPSQTPESRVTPPYQSPHASPGEHPPSGYVQYTRDSPPVIRRQNNTNASGDRQPMSLSTQTPPLQAINARTPDRSLPVQEEIEDEPGGAPAKDDRDMWQGGDQVHHEHHDQILSPTSSSDLNLDSRYDGSRPDDGRTSRTGHRDNNRSAIEQEDTGYQDRERGEDEEGYTPRSPTAGLPEHPHDQYYPMTNNRPAQPQPVRGRARNGVTDQLGMRSFDSSVFDHDKHVLTMGSDPMQYAEQLRRLSQGGQQQQEQRQEQPQPQQQQQQQRPQQQQQQSQSQRFQDPRLPSNQTQAQYTISHMHPDDIQNYIDDSASPYIQSYLQSSRPDAPIPPTPHSQTAAPSPSPLISGGYGGKDLPPFSPVAPVGSPYPYPFSHVRRTQTFAGHPNRPQIPASYDPNHPSVIQEQLAKQWQIYAQNNHDNISNSTFSPSSTPFPGAGYNPWAYLHTNRTLGRIHDPMSMQSSPSHEPVALPTPPPMVGIKKKDRSGTLRRHLSNRKPPPRVESTQPRETSPEPSSSGEETAGEEHYAAEGNWVNGTASTVPSDDNSDWIDESDDDEDFLDLEYHPEFINNVEKRRRRWEHSWVGLTQAFQSLDRQTDATMVLLAAPSHSTKLYCVSSRSIRRQPLTANATAIKDMRAGFNRIALQRRSTRSHKASLLDRFLLPSFSSGGDGSDGSSESREEDLKRALEAALGSLGALGGIYEQREARWAEEMRRISEDRERVELLLRQVLGEGNSPISARTS